MDRQDESPKSHTADELRSQMWIVGGVFVGTIVIMLALMWAAGWASSGVQGYVRANQLWTQAQKNAVIHLMHYAETGNATHYRQYREAIRLPLEYREARIAMQDSTFDWSRAREAFLAGGTRSQNVPTMIRLARYLGFMRGIEPAFYLWERGDRLIDTLRVEAKTIREAWSTRPPDRARITASKKDVIALNTRLSRGERLFRQGLFTWSSWLVSTLFWSQLVVGLIGLCLGMGVTYRAFTRRQSRKPPVDESE